VPEEKVQPYLTFLQGKVANEKASVGDALRQSLMAVLCSPDFLLLEKNARPVGRLRSGGAALLFLLANDAGPETP